MVESSRRKKLCWAGIFLRRLSAFPGQAKTVPGKDVFRHFSKGKAVLFCNFHPCFFSQISTPSDKLPLLKIESLHLKYYEKRYHIIPN